MGPRSAAGPLQPASDVSERRGRIRIRADEGHCAACEHPHTLDIAYRCAGCDGEVCAVCVVVIRETGEAWCPACRDEDGP
jgi:hypothetical protein